MNKKTLQQLQKIFTITLISATVHQAYALETSATESYHRGSVLNNAMMYSIGGGTSNFHSASRNDSTSLVAGGAWNIDMSCGNFDINASVLGDLQNPKQAANKVKNSFNSLLSNAIGAAKQAIISFPGKLLQRTDPQLYDQLTNGIYQAKLDFENLETDCEEMSDKLMDFSMNSEALKKARMMKLKEKLASGDKLNAKEVMEEVRTYDGKEGELWIGGTKVGGKGQPTKNITTDTVIAGYNMLNGRAVTSRTSVPASQCNGRACEVFKSAKEIADFAEDVVGETSTEVYQNNNAKTVAPAGIGKLIEEETEKVIEKMNKALKNPKSVTLKDLEEISSANIKVTRKVIEELRDNSNGGLLADKLANEVALSRVVEKALITRRALIAGMKEPYIASDPTANGENGKTLALLDQEIQQLKLELEFNQMLGNNTALMALSSSHAQRMQNATPTVIDNSLEALENLDKPVDKKGE